MVFVLTSKEAADCYSMLFASMKFLAIWVLNSESIIQKFRECPMGILINRLEHNCKLLFDLEPLDIWSWCGGSGVTWCWSAKCSMCGCECRRGHCLVVILILCGHWSRLPVWGNIRGLNTFSRVWLCHLVKVSLGKVLHLIDQWRLYGGLGGREKWVPGLESDPVLVQALSDQCESHLGLPWMQG